MDSLCQINTILRGKNNVPLREKQNISNFSPRKNDFREKYGREVNLIAGPLSAVRTNPLLDASQKERSHRKKTNRELDVLCRAKQTIS